MGQGQSTLAENGIFISLDKYSYYPGEVLSGTIYLNLVKPTTVRSVKLKLGGKEKVRI
jgi:hypothetical protein